MLAVDHDDSFQATETGFSVIVNGRRVEYFDTDVRAIRIHSTPTSSTTGQARRRESLEIRVRGTEGERVVRVAHEFGRGDANLLESFCNRLLEELLVTSLEALKRGDEVESHDWSISLAHFTDRQSGLAFPLQEISAVAWHGDAFCLWREGDVEPFASYARDTENVYLLERILGFFVKGGPPPGATAQGQGQGQLLAEFRDASPRTQTVMGIIAAVGVLLALFSLRIAFGGAPLFFGVAFASLAAMGGLLAAVHFCYGRKCSLLHYENALVFDRGDGENVLPLDRIATFGAEWVDHYYNYAYTGTSVRLKFVPFDETSSSIAFSTSANRNSEKYEQLQALQADVAQRNAGQMWQALKETGRVRWTNQLTILPDGLEFCKRRGAEPQLVRFERVSRWKMDKGKLKVWVDGGWTPTIAQRTDEANFFPGLYLLEQLAGGEDAESERWASEPVAAR